MFCPNCGKNLPDNAAFCDGCGSRMAPQAPAQPQAPVYAQPPVQPQAPVYTPAPGYAPVAAPAQHSPLLDNSLAAIKGFFSKDPVAAVEKAGKSTGLEWLVLFGIVAFFNMLGSAISPLHYKGGEFDALGLVSGLLDTGVWFFGMAVALMLMVKLMFNRDLPLTNLFNMTSVAILPLGCAALANILFGFVWSGFTATISSVALIAFALLVYLGLQKISGLQISVWTILVVFAIVYLADVGFAALWSEITTPKTPSISDLYSYLR